ncbi:TPA: sugar phosphate isomerase/epimerase [Candidatus Poribacteria bacterium]|jgi:sugar phosphate isomerase/epimerase|nr:sugar phosphate isomerase/epimerase [Candidatus Poribacteria bacterium]HIA69894.1 sugar phosphate isomerase/epimerase [Candidatus Poribacteria bacterium]HIB91017.1 sugar phosphate isomerase/epimerase [Candidatus Poribacteria bacterium]HIB99692.1 sugar phosphate isomerase/epimerase [Candidatus Poribacteria bacterium]HIM11315.1 sugar phosphate isomerase/epimerase [Candidatus Poribacteria bacterium]
MKTALHSVSYAGFWSGQVQLTLEQFLEKASSLGYEAVMLVAKRPHLSPLDAGPDRLKEIRDLLNHNNLRLACIAGYTDFCAGVDHSEIPHREMQILYVVELARIASNLGGNLIRVFTGYERPDISYDQQWNWCVESLAECARRAADWGVTIGVQNHHDIAAHYDSLHDLLTEIDHPNCKAMFDAWSPALQGVDLVSAANKMASLTVHTTVADYVNRPRFCYQSRLVNYQKQQDVIRAVPMGEGFIDYSGFFNTLKANGYNGYVAYEMCSVLEGGGSEENLDRCAKQFMDYMKDF